MGLTGKPARGSNSIFLLRYSLPLLFKDTSFHFSFLHMLPPTQGAASSSVLVHQKGFDAIRSPNRRDYSADMAYHGTAGRPPLPLSGAALPLASHHPPTLHVFPTPEDVALGIAGMSNATLAASLLGSFREYAIARVAMTRGTRGAKARGVVLPFRLFEVAAFRTGRADWGGGAGASDGVYNMGEGWGKGVQRMGGGGGQPFGSGRSRREGNGGVASSAALCSSLDCAEVANNPGVTCVQNGVLVAAADVMQAKCTRGGG